jgi:nicotinate-nucleotide adenylyltransferase
LSKHGSRSIPEHLKVPPAAPGMRIGLLGGSFNPAHAGHLHISRVALARLGLDQVWWLVSPGNPLKNVSKLPDLETRVAAARDIAHHPRIAVTGFEGALGSGYTIDTIRFLQRRYPQVHFVWLMGADNLALFHRWRAWAELFRRIPIAVLDRPGFRLKARASKAAQRFASGAKDESDAAGLVLMEPPAWILLTIPLSKLSSTELRAKPGKAKPGKSKQGKKKGGQGGGGEGRQKKDQATKKKPKRH